MFHGPWSSRWLMVSWSWYSFCFHSCCQRASDWNKIDLVQYYFWPLNTLSINDRFCMHESAWVTAWEDCRSGHKSSIHQCGKCGTDSGLGFPKNSQSLCRIIRGFLRWKRVKAKHRLCNNAVASHCQCIDRLLYRLKLQTLDWQTYVTMWLCDYVTLLCVYE